MKKRPGGTSAGPCSVCDCPPRAEPGAMPERRCGFASQTRNANTSGMVPIERTLDMRAMLAPAEVSSP